VGNRDLGQPKPAPGLTVPRLLARIEPGRRAKRDPGPVRAGAVVWIMGGGDNRFRFS
jgi:hypothetical protein